MPLSLYFRVKMNIIVLIDNIVLIDKVDPGAINFTVGSRTCWARRSDGGAPNEDRGQQRCKEPHLGDPFLWPKASAQAIGVRLPDLRRSCPLKTTAWTPLLRPLAPRLPHPSWGALGRAACAIHHPFCVGRLKELGDPRSRVGTDWRLAAALQLQPEVELSALRSLYGRFASRH